MKIGEKSGKTQSSESSRKFAPDAFASGCTCALHLSREVTKKIIEATELWISRNIMAENR